jgi:hypothetical protein
MAHFVSFLVGGATVAEVPVVEARSFSCQMKQNTCEERTHSCFGSGRELQVQVVGESLSDEIEGDCRCPHKDCLFGDLVSVAHLLLRVGNYVESGSGETEEIGESCAAVGICEAPEVDRRSK